MKKELYYMAGIDDDGEIIEAIGIASVMFLVVERWFRGGVMVVSVRLYS